MDDKTNIQLFNHIFTHHRERFIRFAYSYTHKQEVAEDLVTESLIYYWENRARLQDVKDVPLYILVTLKNKCLDYLQRERTWENIAENLLTDQEWELQMRISNLEACEPETLFSREVQDLLRQALDKMPDKTRRIFIMSRYEGKSYPTIAQKTEAKAMNIENSHLIFAPARKIRTSPTPPQRAVVP